MVWVYLVCVKGNDIYIYIYPSTYDVYVNMIFPKHVVGRNWHSLAIGWNKVNNNNQHGEGIILSLYLLINLQNFNWYNHLNFMVILKRLYLLDADTSTKNSRLKIKWFDNHDTRNKLKYGTAQDQRQDKGY